MNPLTLVKRTQKITERETALGISEEASWHAKYKGSAYIFVGGIPFDLTEGDLLAVFAQYGEMVDVNLVRDKGTGKSKGFAFIAYEDQRSTILAVDNLNGAQILGRIIRVDHVSNYKKKEEEDEETQRQKREARGVCRAFQRGECTRGAGCKFSHDEQRAANTGWGERDKEPRWGHDRFEDSKKVDKRSDHFPPTYPPKPRGQGGFKSNENGTDEETERRIVKRSRKYDEEDDPYESRSRYSHDDRDDKGSRRHDDDDYEPKPREDCDRREEKRSRRHDDYDYEPRSREDRDRREERREDKVSRRHDVSEPRSREDRDRREDKREANKVSRRHEDSEPRSREDRDRREERREDKVSRRHDGSEPRSREDRDRREEVREGMAYRRHDESKPRSREDRDRHERGSRRH